jgi:UTP--glucose-1-phosphate uridylyltransferase
MNEILFITGPGKTSIENHFGINHELVQTLRETGKEELLAELEFDRFQAQYYFTRQRQLLGLGHAVLCARSFVDGQPFVVALGDSIIGLNAPSDIVSRMQRCFAEHDCSAVIAFEEVPSDEVTQYGIARPKNDDDVFELVDIIEKPDLEEAPSNLAVAARYIFTPQIFDALDRTQPGKGGEIQLTDAIKILLEDGETVYGVRLEDHEHRYDIGNFESYFRAFTEFALADEKYGTAVREYIATLNGAQG